MRKLLFTLFAISSFYSWAQLRALDHSDYDGWNRISTYTLANDGKYMAVQTSPQEGDSHVDLIKTRNGRSTRYERASGPSFTADGKWLFFTVSPAYAEVRRLKLKDTPKDEMPEDHLVRVNVRSGKTDTIFNVSSFDVHQNQGAYISIFLEDEKEVEEEEDADSTTTTTDYFWDGEEKVGSGYTDEDAKRLVIWNLETNVRDTIERASELKWASKVANAVIIQSAGDSTQPATVLRWFNDQPYTAIDTAFEGVKKLSMDELGVHVAYLVTHDSENADIHYYDLKLSEGSAWASVVLEAESDQLPEGWMLSEFNSLNFSEDGRSLYMATRPVPFIPEEDTTVLESEKVSLDIWSWTDEDIQPMQKINSRDDKHRSYEGRFILAEKKWVQLEDETVEHVRVDLESELDYTVGYMVPHSERASMSWNYPTPMDFYIVDLNTGEKKRIVTGVRSWPSLSPAGKYVYWWDGASLQWKGYRVEDGQDLILSANISTPVYDEEHDTPNEPGSYGYAGWSEGDENFYIYDAYDIWSVIPGGSATNMTGGKGRNANTRYRYIQLDRDQRFLSTRGDWILESFNESDKSNAYVEFSLENRKMETLVGGDFMLSDLMKADSAEVYVYRKQTFVDYPELYVVRGDDLADAEVVTETNPQQSDVRWGTSELVEWTTPTGIELQGLLYKPQDFDPTKKYPVLVYFYETYSDLLHRHYLPAPSASVINFPYFLSNEYVIFIPDVVYEEGRPGKSAEDCILSGAQMIAQYPWADASNMAIQGQSWGGYQVAHLVTRTDMFKCAMAGAPVSNMTSAYGGIRWGSGMSREFQYERTQSRIGGTLWERTDLYLENSPVFYAHQVETPLLIMHNDNDGAVPWYQGIEYFMALRRLQKPVWMLVYNGEEHNLMQRHNRKDLSVRMAQFFDHYLKGAPAPEWMVKGRPYNEKDFNSAINEYNENE
ncbi:alpha/beta hydrolase family protein [Phaeocystidibacter marisrubri]|uniref:S9 family peptidase n=1 Tax=Phaeocystidibacter marisrubri TaxID=1577780 RepID=A0A6L3ZFT4_9FLAO|nr:prolyl oligopeptidase family serine peptidase [Phaeocystidibacter marisrubri]KAB2816902.1 S9 family peptidase [Phaeocystidibacter marisrubri]GGH77665.1 hypothetical protein GCM10011318_27780 [Phaeocystidibacter marisrubri]